MVCMYDRLFDGLFRSSKWRNMLVGAVNEINSV